jgi:hypothetical protein
MSKINSYIAQSSTINPYRCSLYEIWKRLKWDGQKQSWSSRKKLKQYREKYHGKKAVILCNGPSLVKSDLSLLDGIFTFGLNKINLLFDKSNFRPSFIVAVNPFVIDQNADFFNSTEIPLFFDSCATKDIADRTNVIFMHSSAQNKFAKDCSVSIYQGSTVTFVAMQLAFHMGFTKVALIGCDHSFTTKGIPGSTVTSMEKDPNHFDPSYFAGGVQWQLPDLYQSAANYSLADSIYRSEGREIVNCTEGGELDIFNRKKLSDFIRE